MEFLLQSLFGFGRIELIIRPTGNIGEIQTFHLRQIICALVIKHFHPSKKNVKSMPNANCIHVKNIEDVQIQAVEYIEFCNSIEFYCRSFVLNCNYQKLNKNIFCRVLNI